jgi:hypothetical protein
MLFTPWQNAQFYYESDSDARERVYGRGVKLK